MIVKLIGGRRNGDSVEVNGWQRVYVSTIRLSMEEADALMIDDVQGYRWPQEFYVRERAKDNFVFEKRVDYKP
jgi:hypothetical protein